MTETLTCPTCDYTLHGDEPEIVKVCDVCRLAHQVAKLNVSELWRFVDTLKSKEFDNNYTYSGIQNRINFLQGERDDD